MKKIKEFINTLVQILFLKENYVFFSFLRTGARNVIKGKHSKTELPCHLREVKIGDYTYISMNSWITGTQIGKFCSIGPNLLCGWGIHPTTGLSTSPAFYSTKGQSGISFVSENKIEERKPIVIGNDVFIGANVTILDGINIGDGAIIGAGAVVSKDIPPYAIAVGSPIKILKFRFNEEQIKNLLKIEWWNFDEDKLSEIEKYFFDVEKFIAKYR